MNPLGDLFTGLQYVANMHHAAFNKAHPRAKAWTDVWAEVRHSYGATFPSGTQCRTALVVCEHNTKTGTTKDRLLLAGTGDTYADTISDLVMQLRREFPHVYDSAQMTLSLSDRGCVMVKPSDTCYPTGFIGPIVVGVS